MKTGFAAALFMAVAALFSCATGSQAPPKNPSNPPAFGMVYDDDNLPVSGARVVVDDEKPVTSDFNGRFALAGLSPGSHSLVVTKTLFESAHDEFDYQSSLQLIYVKLISLRQLVARAERALERRDLAQAGRTVERALAVMPEDFEARYAAAVLAYRGGRAAEARSILEDISSEGCREPAVYLFLADIAQYAEKNRDRAVDFLKRGLDLRRDPDVEARMSELTKDAAEPR
jgi:tetratricopeptide (TPR) repeat protein